MSVAAIAAAHVVMMNSRSRYGGGGSNDDDGPEIILWFLGFILACMVCFLAYMIFTSFYDREMPAYVVKGNLHSYEYRTSGKVKKVFVNILQEDGVIRQYNTGYRPSECNQRTFAVELPVKVTPTYNEWTKDTRYESQLMLDACSR